MKKIFLLIILIIFSISKVNAETISFNDVLDSAMQNSYDLKIAKIDIGISTQGIRGAKSDYFPKLSAYATSEYLKDLDNGPSQQVAYIGNEVLLNNSQYQSSLSLGLTYNLFDFGIRNGKVDIAKKDKTSKEATYSKELRDLKLNVSGLYAKALLSYKEYKNKEQILETQKQLLAMQERLNVSGKAPKTQSLSQAVKVVELQNSIDKAKNEYSKALNELSYYTRKEYTPEKLDINDFNQNETVFVSNVQALKTEKNVSFIIEKTPEFKIYQIEIEKKQKELEIKKKENLPQFNFSTNYYLYGVDPSHLLTSYGNLAQRGIKFRLNSSLPLFDGFKNKSERERIKLEIEKLQITKEQKLAELCKTYYQIQEDAAFSQKQLENTYKMLELVNQNISMLERLDQNKLIDKTTYLNQRIELLNKRLELEQAEINDYLASFKLDTMLSYE